MKIALSHDVPLLILRLWLSLSLFIKHGMVMAGLMLRSLYGPTDYYSKSEISLLIFAVLADSICTLLVLFGFATRLASLIVLVYLLFIFIFLNKFSLSEDFGELIYLYSGGFLVLCISGAGNISIDSQIGRKQLFF